MIEFLTFQTFILVSLKYVYNIEVLNLHFLTFLVLLGGCYITFVKQFLVFRYYDENQIDVSGRILTIFNILFHILPFLYIWLTSQPDRTMLLETYSYIICYYYLFDPRKVYFIEDTMLYTLNGIMCLIAFVYYMFI
jgi:hypothetical protein